MTTYVVGAAGEAARWRPLDRDDFQPPEAAAVTRVGSTRVGAPGTPPARPFAARVGVCQKLLARARTTRAVVVRLCLGLVFALSCGVGTILGAPDKATAGFFDVSCGLDSTFSNITPEPRVQDSFLPAEKYVPKAVNDASAAPNGPWTTFEKFGTRGTQFSRTTQLYSDKALSDDESARSCSIQNMLSNGIAQQFLDLDRFLVSSQIGIQQRATDSEPLLKVMRKMSPTVGKLRDQVFVPGASILMALNGLWILSLVVRREGSMRTAVGAMCATMAAILACGWLLMPTRQSNTMGSTPVATGKDPNFYWAAATVNDARDKAIGALAGSVVGNQSKNDVCYLPEGADGRAQRLVQCRLWESLLFRPWAQAMFGDKGLEPITGWPKHLKSGQFEDDLDFRTTGTKDLRVVLLAAQAFSNDGDYLLRKERSNSSPPAQNPTPQADGVKKIDQDKDQFVLYYQVFHALAPVSDAKDKAAGGTVDQGRFGNWSSFRGEHSGGRITAAMGAIVAAAMTGVVVVVTSLLTLIWNAVPIILMVALAFFGLLGAFAPTRKHLATFFQTWAKASILGFGFGVVQLLSAVIVSALLTMTGISLGWKCLLLVVLLLAMFKLMKALQEDAFTPDLGGSNVLDPTDAVNRGREKVTRVTSRTANVTGRRVAGAATGATAGAASAGRRGLADRKDRKARETQQRDGLQSKEADLESRKNGKLRDKTINEMTASRFLKEKPKSRSAMSQQQQAKRLQELKAEEAERYDKAFEKDYESERADLDQQKEALASKTSRSVGERAKGVGAAARTGAGAAGKGAAAGGIAASRYRGTAEGFRSGRVSNTGASTRSSRADRKQSKQRSRRDEFAREENQRRSATDDAKRYAQYDQNGKPRAGSRAEKQRILEEVERVKAPN